MDNYFGTLSSANSSKAEIMAEILKKFNCFGHMLTPMDIFDGILEKVQQFPLDSNNFERHLKRLNRSYDQYKQKFERLVSKLVQPSNRKFVKVKSKLKRCIHKKVEVTERYEKQIADLITYLDEMIKISGIAISFSPALGKGPAIIKISSDSTGNKKYCICNSSAYGTMICCDNPSCPVKWYHFKCANITTPPKDEWKCLRCRSERKL